jgi:thiamine biosynthesis lipoprotein ApbE
MKRLTYTVIENQLVLRIKDEVDKATLQIIKNTLDREIKEFKSIADRLEPSSELYDFNNSITDFEGSREFFDYLSDAIYWFGITGGIFNPFITTVMEDLKNYRDESKWADGTLFKLNNLDLNFPKKINDLANFVDIDYTNQRVKFKRPLSCDFSGMRKGKFIDKMCKKLSQYIKYFSINFGGDAFYIVPKGQTPWTIDIDNPITKQKDVTTLQANNEAISVSGKVGVDGLQNTTSYVLLNPQEQRATQGKFAVVIVKSKMSITSDVLAKSFFIASGDEREKLQKKFPEIQRIEIMDDGRMVIY